MAMMESLGWAVLFLGLWYSLLSTLLFPLMRRFNAWGLAWYTRVAERQRMPFADLIRRLGEWWIAREGLQRACGIAMGLVLLAVWWFVWGPRAN
jgi:hypothetical protein